MITWKLLIEVSIILLIATALFWLIKPTLTLAARRFTLLALPLLSIGIVLVRSFFDYDYSVVNIPLVELDPVSATAQQATGTDYQLGWIDLYLIGVLVMMTLLLFRVIRLVYFFRKAKPHRVDKKFCILVTANKNSFSFFNYIHLSANLDEDERKVVLEHEMLHINKHHSLDLIMIHIYHALFWFNPVMIILKRELVQTHEYEVDEVMYSRYDEAYLGHLLSYTLGTSVAHLLLTSQFYQKMTLAKRIKKMKMKNRTNRFAVLIIPGMILSLGLISWTYTGSEPSFSSAFSNHSRPGDGELDRQPAFKGGQEELISFMSENVRYPESARKNKIEGTVFVAFIVETTGKLSDVKIEKGVHDLLDAESIRVVNMMPDWIPGEKNGKPVKAQMTLPISFKL